MNQWTGTRKDFSDQFSALEETGRQYSQDAKIEISYFDDDRDTKPTSVTIGLPPELYRLVYRTNEMDQAALCLPAGARVIIRQEDPGIYLTEGPELVLRKFMETEQRPVKGMTDYPLMYHLDHPQRSDLILRIMYRAAQNLKARMCVSTEELQGRLEYIMAPWMLDTYDRPKDILVTKRSEWAVYHVATQCAFESSDWFFEAFGLTDKMNKSKGEGE